MDYKYKYKKYKNKYFSLINQNGGNISTVDIRGYTNIIFLTGGTGTVGKSLLRYVSQMTDNKYFIFYTTRDCIKMVDINLTNTHCLQYDFNTPDDLLRFIGDITTIKDQYTNKKIYIINSAADKDTSKVKTSFNTQNNPVNLFTHWSFKLATGLAEFSMINNIRLIHFSTVYVNKGFNC